MAATFRIKRYADNPFGTMGDVINQQEIEKFVPSMKDPGDPKALEKLVEDGQALIEQDPQILESKQKYLKK